MVNDYPAIEAFPRGAMNKFSVKHLSGTVCGLAASVTDRREGWR